MSSLIRRTVTITITETVTLVWAAEKPSAPANLVLSDQSSLSAKGEVTMVLYVFKYNIHPDKGEAYAQFVRRAIPILLNAPGVVELRAYRPVAGGPQVVATWEFADMAAWAAWQSNADVQNALTELSALTLNLTQELWGPSPVVPAPLRPGQ